MAELGNQIILALAEAVAPMTDEEIYANCEEATSLAQVRAALRYRVKTGLVEEVKRVVGNVEEMAYRLIETAVQNEPVDDLDKKPAGDTEAKDAAGDGGEPSTARPPAAAAPGGLTLGDYRAAAEFMGALTETDKEQQFTARLEFLSRSLRDAEKLLDDYLETVVDPAIYEPLKGMRDLAQLQLEQLVQPTGEENEGTGIVRSGTG